MAKALKYTIPSKWIVYSSPITMFKKTFLGAAFALAAFSTSLQAQVRAGNTNRSCAFTDLTGVSVTGCSGFWAGNVLSGNSGDQTTQNTELNALLGTSGVNYWTTKIESESPTDGNFNRLLVGVTAIGIHWGNGAPVFGGSPNYALAGGGNANGGGTAFYVFDAGAGIDVFGFAQRVSQGQSTGIVYITGTETRVPEPSSFALVAAGLAGLGVAARRRRNQA